MGLKLLTDLLTTVSSLTGTTTGSNLFGQTLPTSPAVVTAVVLTGGFFDGANPVRLPTFQILHRNTHVSSGFTFVCSLHAELKNTWNRLPRVKGRIQALAEPGFYAYDQNNRPVFSMNFSLTTVNLD